ncbi:MAG: NAD(P)-dependent oxidoreductase [Thermodesulfobacteriota bacterium]
MKNLLIVGAGTIGNYTAAQALLHPEFAGIHLVDVNPHRDFIATLVDSPKVEISRLDIREFEAVMPFFMEKGITHVIDTACIPHNHESKDIRAYVDVNAFGLTNLLEAARLTKVQKYVYCSTNAVYDFTQKRPQAPVEEEWPTLGTKATLYAHTKLLGEKLVSTYRHYFQLDGASFRLTVIYGPCPDYNMGSKTWIHRIVQAAAQDRRIHLKEIPRKRLCWMYARDAANALLTAALLEKPFPSDVYNVSAGVLYGMEEIVQGLKKAIPDLDVNIGEIQDVGWKYPLDITKMREEVGFNPSISMDEALADYVHWIWQHPEFAGGVAN